MSSSRPLSAFGTCARVRKEARQEVSGHAPAFETDLIQDTMNPDTLLKRESSSAKSNLPLLSSKPFASIRAEPSLHIDIAAFEQNEHANWGTSSEVCMQPRRPNSSRTYSLASLPRPPISMGPSSPGVRSHEDHAALASLSDAAQAFC